jgi:MFS family permease
MLRDSRVWCFRCLLPARRGTYAITFWLPTLIKSWGVSDLLMIGLYAAVPNVFGIVGMILMARSSDRRKERRWHFMAAALIVATGSGSPR